MHTFVLKCVINEAMFHALISSLKMVKESDWLYKTNSYSGLGLSEIGITVYTNANKSTGEVIRKFYLYLRCNAGKIMDESGIFALDLESYTADEIIDRIQTRIKQVVGMRFLNLHRMEFELWRADRIDLAVDVPVQNPELLICLLNMSFPFGYCNMKPYRSKKGEIQKLESCYFFNKGSRTVNIYHKQPELTAHEISLDEAEHEAVRGIVRIEVQIRKKGIYSVMSGKADKRNIRHFLSPDFAYGYIEKTVTGIFGSQKYVTKAAALDIISRSNYRPKTKAVLCSIIRQIQNYDGIYKLEQSIADANRFTPPAYGDKAGFRRLLKKIRELGISPVTISDSLADGSSFEVPSLYELLQQKKLQGGSIIC